MSNVKPHMSNQQDHIQKNIKTAWKIPQKLYPKQRTFNKLHVNFQAIWIKGTMGINSTCLSMQKHNQMKLQNIH